MTFGTTLVKKAMTTIQNTVVPHSSGQYVGRGGSDYRGGLD
jgi:hypothetical protein